jgi:hypothetical protein
MENDKSIFDLIYQIELLDILTEEEAAPHMVWGL